jgi:hypothetical protein
MKSPQWIKHKPVVYETVNIRPDLGKPDNQDAKSYHDSYEVMHPIQESLAPNDAGYPRERLIPVDEPPPNPYANSDRERIQAVHDFINKITHISESEYGDWQRRVALYWGDLADAFTNHESKKIHEALNEMIRVVDFNPNFLILETEREVIALAMQICDELGAPLHPNEIPETMSVQTSEAPVPDYSLRFKNPRKPDVEAVVNGSNGQGYFGK